MQPKLLVVDDEAPFCLSISRYLTRAGFAVDDAGSLAEARDRLRRERYAGVLLDLRLPDGDGLDSIREFRRGNDRTALVVITGSGDIPIAVEAMRRGADHFVTKPFEPAELERFLRATIHSRGDQPARPSIDDGGDYVEGCGPASALTRELASLAAESDSVVLLSGETGSGKGALARWIHDHSRRSSKPFVEVNCSMLRGELLANELFGHTRGAFTSAVDGREGLLDAADGGTLFLDEIGDMDVAIQAQFLKVVEEKQYRRLGDTKPRRSNFRLICATNHDLAADVASGRFRADLLYRINVLPITLPPLRHRGDDIAKLAAHLARKLARKSISSAAIERLAAYDWPGNVRELRNVIERAALVARGAETIGVEHLSGLDGARVAEAPAHSLAAIHEAIARCNGDKSRAAKLLGISRATLYRRLA